MRAVSIAVFLFCVHISMALLNTTGVFDVAVAPSTDWINSVDKNYVQNESYVPSQVNSGFLDVVADTVKGFFYFIFVFGFSVIVLPWTFIQFGLPAGIATLLAAPFYLMYLFGIAQWLANRNERSQG